MLLREYLLLDLGRMTAAEAGAWRADMVARRQVDACRDLLAFSRPREMDQARLLAHAVAGLRRFTESISLEAFAAGLLAAAQQALRSACGVEAQPAGDSLEAGGHTVCTVSAERHGDVAAGNVALELAALMELTAGGSEVNPKMLANALAYHFEQVFSYAQAAKHPIAYEESLRPKA